MKLLNTWTAIFPDEMLAVIRHRVSPLQAPPNASAGPFSSTVPLTSPPGPGYLQLQGQVPGSVPLVSQGWPSATANSHRTPFQAAPLAPSYPRATNSFPSSQYQQQQHAQHSQQQFHPSRQQPEAFTGFSSMQTAAPSQPTPLPASNGPSRSDAPASTANILQLLLQAGMLSMPNSDGGMGMQQAEMSSANPGHDSLSPKAVKVLH